MCDPHPVSDPQPEAKAAPTIPELISFYFCMALAVVDRGREWADMMSKVDEIARPAFEKLGYRLSDCGVIVTCPDGREFGLDAEEPYLVDPAANDALIAKYQGELEEIEAIVASCGPDALERKKLFERQRSNLIEALKCLGVEPSPSPTEP